MRAFFLFCFIIGLIGLQAFGDGEDNPPVLTNSYSVPRLWKPNPEFDSIVWGKPAYHLSLGINMLHPASFAQVGTTLRFYLISVGETNAIHEFAPPDFQKSEVHLYDRSGREVSMLPGYHYYWAVPEPGGLLPGEFPRRAGYRGTTNHFYTYVSDIPQNGRGWAVGGIATNDKGPTQYDSICITNIFNLKQGENYTLIGKARVMIPAVRPAGPGRLRVVDLPPVSLLFHL
jgi:hypothetical protein